MRSERVGGVCGGGRQLDGRGGRVRRGSDRPRVGQADVVGRRGRIQRDVGARDGVRGRGRRGGRVRSRRERHAARAAGRRRARVLLG